MTQLPLFIWRVLFSQEGAQHDSWVMVVAASEPEAVAVALLAVSDPGNDGRFIPKGPDGSVRWRDEAVKSLRVDESYTPRLVTNHMVLIGDNGDCC